MKTRSIKIKNNEYYETATLRISDKEIAVVLGNREIARHGEYAFITLKEIRKELEKENIFLMVNGSRIDVYPSGLSLSGFNAYIHTLGKPASLDQLVDIFGDADQSQLIGTVEEQMKYHANWLESLDNA